MKSVRASTAQRAKTKRKLAGMRKRQEQHRKRVHQCDELSLGTMDDSEDFDCGENNATNVIEKANDHTAIPEDPENSDFSERTAVVQDTPEHTQELEEYKDDFDASKQYVPFSRRKFQEAKNMRQTQRMMNEMRRRRTLARASIPKFKYTLENPEDIISLNNVGQGRPRRVQMPKFYKPKPEEHAASHLASLRDKLKAIKDPAVAKKLRETINTFECNFSLFSMQQHEASVQAAEIDRKDLEKDKQDRAKKKELQAERKAMRAEDDCARFQNLMKEKSSESDSSSITDFFATQKGKALAATERFYRDFYYESILNATCIVSVPSFKDTSVYAELVPPAITPHRQIVNDLMECPSCKEPDSLIEDSNTKTVSCRNCSVLYSGENMFSQSFAQIQASTLKTNAPYERISHVSSLLMLLCFFKRSI